MKSMRIVKACIMACLVFGLVILPVNQLKVQAREGTRTVTGKVEAGTTTDMLLLSTSDGTMKIKIDSETDTTNVKVLLPGKKLYVDIYHGSDKYLHADKITTDEPVAGVSIDAAKTFTVTGKIDKKTNNELMYFNTDDGTLQIKLDPDTDMSKCNFLVTDKTYEIVCARGSDKYLHALSISDRSITYSNTSSHEATGSTSGTVADKTKENLLYLSTEEGVMQFKIDSDADTSNGMVLTQDRKLKVSFYHGNDGYLHAVKIVGDKDNPVGVKLDANTTTLEGKVASKSNENLLYLDTSQGTMQIKLDMVESKENFKVLIKDKKITVTFARGSDAYMHAIKIVAN